MLNFKRMAAAAVLPAMILGGFATAAGAQDVSLPKTLTWSTYDVGSSGYVEASAIADAMIKGYGVRIRLTPSSSGIGRLLPLKTGRVQFAFLGNEANFASEALYEFSNREWGPQDVRVLLGRPAEAGVVAASDAGIKTVADLRGKRVSFVEANPSANIKTEAVLAFGGMTWADVDRIDMPSYGSALKGLSDGTVQAAVAIPTAAALRELESGRGATWMELPADDTEGWARLHEVASFVKPREATIGAGISTDAPAQLMGYRYPMITVYADADEELVYNMTKAVVESFPVYKGMSPIMASWSAAESGKSPSDAPFHPGAVKYLKEINVWTDEDEAWNQKRLARSEAMMKAWEAANEKALDENVSDADWAGFWESYKAENLK
ncbi:TAXI family TRAP transporter solute-binding subunit [Pseudooceanicola sp.]|uniref:TAXI family TRAP transporter solute-binding subunit n=1 Tax=Pseudooceanicola sp. TaxID=1914328 RepID=UPI002636FBFA|nr:TAXI family TRAP transporter solute-binding subunit [Pseudooceanicola sp.]MDF1857052.1 TAXI family TRAP transporter solute-binding subunit [Pseudooceanicola sp.]